MNSFLHNRREFLKFMGRASGASVVSTAFTTGLLSQFISACSNLSTRNPSLPFSPLAASRLDDLTLAKGLRYNILISSDTPLNQRGETFGYNNDYTALIPFSANDALLWVNHEYPNSYFINGIDPSLTEKTKEHVDKERKAVGGSIVRIQRANENSAWQIIFNDKYNRRIDATTPIPFVGGGKVLGHHQAIGTLANCAGGVTSWGTILTCEENYDNYYGEVSYDAKGERTHDLALGIYKWSQHYPMPPEHYGWVVEVNPLNGNAKKLLPLGRFAHECATTTLAADGRSIVYMGDDNDNECVYKFISKKKNSLEEGDLYVANTEKGEWILLDRDKNSKLSAIFKNQTDLLIQTRKAAHLAGGTPLHRPEDIEIDPISKAIFISQTNCFTQGDLHGSILKIMEDNNDPLSLRFKASIFLTGGPQAGFTCPDNFVFDKKGNLWMTTDISDKLLGNKDYAFHGNNALFYIPMSGRAAGQPLRIATGPIDSELTGPSFDSDFKNLFLSVQHPGANSRRGQKYTSHWPKGGDSKPTPAVVTIHGPLLDQLIGP